MKSKLIAYFLTAGACFAGQLDWIKLDLSNISTGSTASAVTNTYDIRGYIEELQFDLGTATTCDVDVLQLPFFSTMAEELILSTNTVGSDLTVRPRLRERDSNNANLSTYTRPAVIGKLIFRASNATLTNRSASVYIKIQKD